MTDARNVRPGVRDVARLAGVSTQTVSRVLNGFPGIRESTRLRVLDAVADLDYRMNNTARALGTKTTHTLGIIASNATLYGPSLAIEALEAAARSVDHWVAATYADVDDERSVDVATHHLVSQGVDGMVIVAPHSRTLAAARSAASGVAVRALHDGAGAERQARGAAAAVEHLLALGHRSVARIAGPSDWLEASSREAGAVRALGAAASHRWEGDWSAASGAALAAQVVESLRASNGPTAIAVANDQMALGLIAGLRDRGVSVPRDVSVTGFDDNPDAAFYAPALTSVRVDVAGEAAIAVSDVLALPFAPEPAAPELVVRRSTARVE